MLWVLRGLLSAACASAQIGPSKSLQQYSKNKALGTRRSGIKIS